MSIKRTSARAAQSRSRVSHPQPSHAGSIADRLERSPGGIAGALARIEVAKASGRPMTALQKFAAAIGEELPAAGPKAQPNDPSTWPVVWRVVAPAAGSYDNDMTFLETEDEVEARQRLDAARRSGYPVRLERVQCGPLPEDARAELSRVRATNPQNPGTDMRDVLGSWEARS